MYVISRSDYLFKGLIITFNSLIIVSYNSVYYLSSNTLNKFLNLGIRGILVIVCFLWFYSILKENIDIRKIVYLLFSYTVLFGTIMFYQKVTNNLNSYLFFLYFWFPLLLIIFFDFFRQKKYLFFVVSSFRLIVTILAGLSLLLYVLYSINLLSPNMSLVYQWGWPRSASGYYYFFFIVQQPIQFLGIIMPRNTGIFAEAPVFGMLLSIALSLSIFFEKKRLNSWSSWVLIITIFTTTSTTALLVLVLILFFKMISILKGRTKIFSIVLLILSYFILQLIVSSKIDGTQGSVGIRVEDIMAGYNSWLEKPLFGYGFFEGQVKVVEHMGIQRILENMALESSGFFGLLPRVGLIGVIFYLFIPLMIFAKKKTEYMYISVIFVILFVNTIFLSTLIYSYFIILFTFLGIFYSDAKEEEKNERAKIEY
jgi:hypothetical protein